ncbi:MAG TPA: M1 family metallopeptidase [Gemmatimonadaceae bacterium]|nr:M1 family metallopeptidase [Gemmatimonadaceae bacterium]
MRTLVLALAAAAVAAPLSAQQQTFTRADSLRGSYTSPTRAWWDVTFYDLHVAVSPGDSSLRGWNGITYRVLGPARELQLDLMEPLVVDSVVQDGRRLAVRREGAAHFVTLASPQPVGAHRTITAYYHGRPQVATNPPWDGGITWARDSAGRPWIVTTDQGMGASVWWPNKDTQADEPDSQRVALRVPDPLIAVANGRRRATTKHDDGTTTYEWFVSSPINNYAIAINAAHYVGWTETYQGERGPLTLDFWALDRHVDDAKRQWTQVRPMLQCFERWFGPYPWYEDGFKLVEVPYLGMEHQSAVTYGNRFRNGYLGRDLSGTGLGLAWDFIIIHEAAHEWFANAITAKDQADMWVHESFANYAEGIYTECQQGKEAGARYMVGLRRGIRNDRPIIPPYGVNAEGSGDMYNKGGNMLHTIRQLVNDDAKWRGVLRGLGATFGRQTVTGQQIQDHIARESGLDLRRVFAQYLTTTMIPTFEWQAAGDSIRYRWTTVVPGFDMPVRAQLDGATWTTLRPTEQWQSMPGRGEPTVDENYYVRVRQASPPVEKR